MNKAFIFDMDGVIINSETIWERYQERFYYDLFGQEIADKLGDDTGMSLPDLYLHATRLGFLMKKNDFYEAFNQQAEVVYREATITPGFSELISFLQSQKFRLAIVSASPKNWISMTLSKTDVSDVFDYILSLDERTDIRHKPFPDGFLEAIRVLGGNPHNTVILEDSNRGIQAAKASGAYTIGFRQHIAEGYQQMGADVYAESFQTVEEIVKNSHGF